MNLFLGQRVYATVNIADIFGPAKSFPTWGDLINVVVMNLIYIAALIGLLFLIFGGLTIILGAGGGDSKQLEQGKKTITMAVAGLLIVFLSFWIVQILGAVLGINILQPKLLP